MRKGKKVLSVLLAALIICSIVPVWLRTQNAEASGNPITMAAFGQRFPMPGMEDPNRIYGDTWDSTWSANGDLFLQLNDGYGFSGNDIQHSKLTKLYGTPEIPISLSGTNLNPGTLGKNLGSTYSTGIYEVDGALYYILCYSVQIPGQWKFYNSSIMKSTDGGANWINCLGQKNVIPANDKNCTFPDDNVSDFSFVKYGKGGSAPNIDNAQNYVYLISPSGNLGAVYYLARIKRSDLIAWTSTFDRNKIQYYQGGDGMLDSNWTADSSKVASIYNSGYTGCSPANIVFNYGLKRYIMVSERSDSFARPQVPSSLMVYEAPAPWGPWTKVLEENVNNKDSANLTWLFTMQKFQGSGGQKMWMSVTGETASNSPDYTNEYKLQFKPLYLTTNPVSVYQAENAALTGLNVAKSKAGYNVKGYATGFDKTGDSCRFNVTADEAGAYIIKIRYNTSTYRKLSCYVNGTHIEDLKLGKSEQVYATWTEYTLFAWLKNGKNTIDFRYDSKDSGKVNLDELRMALYSTKAGSLPGCYPPGTVTYVNDSSLKYSTNGGYSNWAYENYSTRASDYKGDIHLCSEDNSFVQYTFKGTGVDYINDMSSDLGKVNIYIDNMSKPAAIVSCYNSKTLYQQVIYSNKSLSSGTHTIKIVKKGGLSASIDALKIYK